MPNSKTTPPAPKPLERNGWIRKSDLDAWLGRCLPIPMQAVSNEEFFPIPQTPEQKRLEHEIFAGAEREARLAGTDRRQFLRSSSLRETARSMNPALKNRVPKMEDLYLENYVKEIFLDSETDVVALSALPGSSEESDILTPDVIYKSRSWINEVTSSPRVISHGYFSPDLGQQNLEYMHSQLEKIKIEAWKGYTGWPRAKGVDRWRMDDEKLAYPALDFARKHGIRNICLHKGLPFPGDPERWSPMDVPRAAMDFPDMNFLVYHSGFRDVGEVLPAARDRFQKNSYIPWTSDLVSVVA